MRFVEVEIDAGWFDCELHVNEICIKLLAADGVDTLSQLVTVAASILKGADQAQIIFYLEPREERWFIKSLSPELVRLQILEFESYQGEEVKSKKTGKSLFKTELKKHEFGTGVFHLLDGLHKRYRQSGYHQRWGHPFPMRKFKILRECLESTRG